MRVFFLGVPALEHNNFLLQTLKKLIVSQRFETFLDSTATVKDAVDAYKTDIVKKLNIDFQRRQTLEHRDNAFDKALVSCYITNRNSKTTFKKAITAREDSQQEKELRAKKRSYQTHSTLHELPSNKKYKTSHHKSSPNHRNFCASYEQGDCRRGSRCWNKH